METCNFELADLTSFIVKAKQSTFASDKGSVPSKRPGSHDFVFKDGIWEYQDSFFGTQDFSGREIVYYNGTPVWGMAYYGRVLQQDVSKNKLWSFLKKSILKTYAENRFLGPSNHIEDEWRYKDTNQGDTTCFSGEETISLNDKVVYRLDYFGGLIK